MFDDDDQIETDPLTSSISWFGCDNNDISENVVPTTNTGIFSSEVE